MAVNKQLADELERISKNHRLQGEVYRSNAYHKASINVAKYPTKITSGQQARDAISGIGDSIEKSIDTFLSTGHSDRFQETLEEEIPYAIFETIHGIGSVKAKKLYDEGYRTLEDLENAPLTAAQRIGLTYHTDFERKIPREEIDQINQIFHQLFDPFKLKWEIAGSYRRGAPESGDIDVLFQRDKLTDGGQLEMVDITNMLADYLIANLTDPEKGKTKYMGVIKVGKYARRIDIRLIEPESYYYAILYFTGSKELNKEMRSRAIELGLTLNEYGLYDALNIGRMARSERDIFRHLKIKYIPPNDR